MAERGLRDDSFFTITLGDKSEHREHDVCWRDISEAKFVKYDGASKRVHVCKFPIKKVVVQHGDLKVSLDVKKGQEVYQSVCARTSFAVGQKPRNKVIGRKVGIVKDGVVVEEYFLDVENNTVSGIKI
jgi:hypothetical protein